MKTLRIFTLTIIVISLCPYTICGQTKNLNAFIAPTHRIDNNSSGHTLNLEFNLDLNKKCNFTLGYGQTFTSKKRPKVDPGYTIVQRTRDNLGPLGINFFGWTESDFAGNAMPHENVYHTHDLYLAYQLFEKGQLSVLAGPILSLRQSSEIDRYIYVDTYDFAVFELTNIAIPVYGIQNFSDIGAMVDVNFSLKTFGRLTLLGRYRGKYYPLSSSFMNDLGIVFQVDL